MSTERVYEGESWGGSLQEAVDKAVQRLDADLFEGGVHKPSVTWVVTEISGVHGKNSAGFRSIKAKIKATRTPPWT